MAALLNKGTNYLMGTISSVTDSISVVLQLALAIDYAIIFCDRFMEEHETMDAESAIKVALSKAIPEISSSSLKGNYFQFDLRILPDACDSDDLCKGN